MRSPLSVFVVVAAAAAQTPQSAVLPSAFAIADAPSLCWLAGCCTDARQQTLVGSSHLTALVGHPLTALAFRRSEGAVDFPAGAAQWTVSLSTSPRAAGQCSPFFADNRGTDAVVVWSGPVAFPASPAVAVGPVPWTPPNVVRVAFQQPFVYRGGTLCVEITASPVQGQVSGWWLADASWDPVEGSAVSIGTSCGGYANAAGESSRACSKELVAGAFADLVAFGPPGNLALLLFGDLAPQPVPLTSLGLPSPGCNAYLGSIFDVQLARFEPQVLPVLAGRGGEARISVGLPNQSWLLGATAAVQWLDLQRLETSNALQLTVAGSLPVLDMALVDGVPGDPEGHATVHHAHVLRFEYQ